MIKLAVNIFMKKAISMAKRSAAEGEVPVGAVIVKDGVVISSGRNRREKGKNALAHAEIEAIDKACKKLSGWRLSGCELYVTLEPCPMCAGAIINSRIDKVYIGALDRKGGACLSVARLFDMPFNHKPLIETGVMEEDCSKLLKDFFKNLRENKSQKSERQ